MSAVSPKARELIYARDDARCYHCGTTEGLGLQHRIGRGIGGSKLLNVPSNLLTFCNLTNTAMESDPVLAEHARAMGWKLRRGSEQALVVIPAYDSTDQQWFLLDDDYNRTVVDSGP